MKPAVWRGLWWGGLLSLAVAGAWAQTTRPPTAAQSTLERLKIAVAPLGWDTNFTWLQTRSGMLDKRPALEYLVGIDRYTGAYMPQLAETWVMSPDGKDWTVTLRQGIPFHDNWGEFTARDVRHAVFLISQPEAAASDTGIWPGIWNPLWEQRFEGPHGYDPAQAKALLAQAGYPQGFAFTLYLYTLPGLAEIIDIGQAMALDFQAIGLKPKLVELEFPRLRELFRSRAIHGGLFPSRHSSRALETTRNVHNAKEGAGHWYEHPVIEERLEALRTVVDSAARSRLLREIGDHKFNEFAEIPMFWLFAEAAVNPRYIAEYVFPGVITGSFTHLEYIKVAQ